MTMNLQGKIYELPKGIRWVLFTISAISMGTCFGCIAYFNMLSEPTIMTALAILGMIISELIMASMLIVAFDKGEVA
jgi:hypothetical protein